MEILAFTIIGIISRLIPHLPNMTAVGASLLFISAKFGVKKSIVLLFSTMVVTDFLLGFHQVMWATYGSLLLTILIGRWVGTHNGVKRILIGSTVSSIMFFLITNFAVWLLPNGMYEKSFFGLIHCYIMALPFLRNTMLGDVLYTALFFLGFELVKAPKILWRKILYAVHL